jgi:GntR family transcriptional repressor for pyruvate dehydrogenase complex
MDRPDPVSGEIARRLLAFLISGEIAVGQRIPSERQLAGALGVGRSAIREAIKHLQLLGLLDVRVGDGTYLQEPDTAVVPQLIEWGLLLKADRLLELIEARRYIELALAGLAAERRDQQDLDRIRGHLDTMRESAGNLEAFTEADSAFHFAIAEAAQNRVLAGVLSNLRTLLRVWIARVLRTPGEADRALAEHAVIFAALQDGSRIEAETAMAAHIDHVAARLRDSFAEERRG